MLNGDFVKRLETVYNVKRGAVFFGDAEPLRLIGGVGGFINSGFKLALDEFTNFFIDSGQDWNVFLHPGLVWDCWDLNRWEEVFMEVAPLRVTPCESFILNTHEMVHEHTFFQQ